MRERLPSLTAAAVSIYRSVASLPGSPVDFANDRGMRALMPGPAEAALSALGTITAREPRAHALASAGTLGLLPHVALRTAAIDLALRHERATRGIPQLVLLGAGLDARAYRMPELSETRVFEVDFPSTQALKRARAASLAPRAKELRWAAIDFERDALGEVLARAGHDASVRTVWLWEGVTMYLVKEALEATLAVVRDRSTVGSSLLVTYATDELAAFEAAGARLAIGQGPLAPLVELGFGILGEPLRGRMSPARAKETLARFGLAVESDRGPADWAKTHWRGRAPRIVIGERLAIARRVA
ncbi:MAG: class I SAM-dependent methyltransferase [Sandaracinus sp.]